MTTIADVTARERIARSMPEAELQANILELARLLGWRTFHPYDSRRSTPGFPDLVLVRSGRLIFAELKAEKGRVTTEQAAWLNDLTDVDGIHVHLWRPSDWLNGRIRNALT